VVGSVQSSFLSTFGVEQDQLENGEVSSQVRDRVRRLPRAMPTSQNDYSMLKNRAKSAPTHYFLLPVDVPANQPDGVAPGVFAWPE
jgi:hypothetical protein